jgi:hypothetical protein
MQGARGLMSAKIVTNWENTEVIAGDMAKPVMMISGKKRKITAR